MRIASFAANFRGLGVLRLEARVAAREESTLLYVLSNITPYTNLHTNKSTEA
jgi:hypothetical protein